MTDSERLAIAQKLIGNLQERSNNSTPLHHQADLLAQARQLQPAVRLCQASIEVARRQNDDDYIFGAARFHLALAYFCAGDKTDWDRAAELCEQAARHFEVKNAKREQGVALCARAKILEALCDEGKDRWEQAMRAYAKGHALLHNEEWEHLSQETAEWYGALGRKYVEKGIADEAAAKAAATTTPPDPTVTATNTNPASAPTSHSSTANSASPSVNGAAPKTDVPPAQNSSASANAPRVDVPTGLKSPHPAIAHSFRKWQLGAIIAASALCVFVLILAGIGLSTLWTGGLVSGDPYAFGLMLGLGSMGLGVVIVTTALLYLTSQLVFKLTLNQVAVVIQGGRIWTIEEVGRHWLVPFAQDLAAIVPKIPKPYEKFMSDVAMFGNRALDVYIRADYSVSAPDHFWRRVLSTVERSKIWGIPRPLTPEAIQIELDKQAHALLGGAVVHITNDPEKRRLAARQDIFKAQVLEYLEAEAAKDGIRFENVSFRVMQSNLDGSL